MTAGASMRLWLGVLAITIAEVLAAMAGAPVWVVAAMVFAAGMLAGFATIRHAEGGAGDGHKPSAGSESPCVAHPPRYRPEGQGEKS